MVLCVPIEGEADVAMQVSAVTAGMAPKRRVEIDQDTLAAQARDTWHSIQDGDSCRVLPIEDATLLELNPKLLHMRTLHEVFTNEISYILESYSNHHKCCCCFHGWWVVAPIKLPWH